jgi:hypothetical protein
MYVTPAFAQAIDKPIPAMLYSTILPNHTAPFT